MIYDPDLSACTECGAVQWTVERDAIGYYLVCWDCGHRTGMPAWYRERYFAGRLPNR